MAPMAGTSYAELNELLASDTTPSVTEEQLLALQRRWVAALSARLDAVLELVGCDPDEVARAWRKLAAEHATLRGLLDAGVRRSQVLADAQRAELRMLALAAGLASLDDPAEEAAEPGRSLRDRRVA